MLDTGSTTSTILDGDCERLGLDCKRLRRSNVLIVGSVAYVRELLDAAFFFLDTEQALRVVNLEHVNVFEQTETSPRPHFSLMGMDILSRFKRLNLDFQNGDAFLES